MIVREVYFEEKDQFNKVVPHPLQSWEWGEFRQKTGLKVFRLGLFEKKKLLKGIQMTLHPIPYTSYYIGYIPKCSHLNLSLLTAIKNIGKENNCIFIKIEPHLTEGKEFFLQNGCVYGRPLFTKYTFQIDLTQSEEELLAKMKPKTRYNIKLAQKHGVTIKEDNSFACFQQYLKLTFETTKRQKFYAHTPQYHQLMWETLYPAEIAHLLKAEYQGEVLVTWILFIFNQVAYYPYGASSRKYKNVMASNLMMWEAIRFAKKMGCHTFDLWGSLGPNPNPKNPWYGFHRFKEGYGPKLIEFIGTFDLILDLPKYQIYTLVDKIRWQYLKIRAKLPF